MTDPLYSPAQPADTANDYNTWVFMFRQLVQKLQTVTLVEVVGVTNVGGVEAVGLIDVRPMLNQMTPQRTAVEHETIYNVPYVRLQGGLNAVILDPQVGDIGLCAFASRDITTVKNTKARGNPGSLRIMDWADALYMGGVLNATPTQYVQFNEDGITLHSATKVTIEAPTVAITGNLTVSGTTTGTGDGTFAGIDVALHTHSGVTTGSGVTGPPI